MLQDLGYFLLNSDLGNLTLILLCVSIIFIITFYIIKQKNILKEHELSIFKNLLIYIFILNTIYYIFIILPISTRSIEIIINLFNIVLGIGIATLFLPKIISVQISKTENKEYLLKKQIENIFDSESFLSALRSSLPKGEKDEEFGLDYIPYLLHNLDEKRKRFKKSSRIFLITTITTGVLFVGITVMLGIIIYDEQSVGTAKTIKDLENSLDKISQGVFYLDSKINERNKEIQKIKSSIKENIRVENGYTDDINQIEDALNNLNYYSQIDSTIDLIDNITPNLTSEISKNIGINKIRTELLNLKSNKEAIVTDLPFLVQKNKETLVQLKSQFNESNNRIAEVIKRIVLSFVIISFFLAILRFLANLYKTNHDQMIKTEYEDLMIRKFYVAIKNSDKDNEQKKSIILNFIKQQEFKNLEDTSFDSKKEGYEIIKQLINKLSDKL